MNEAKCACRPIKASPDAKVKLGAQLFGVGEVVKALREVFAAMPPDPIGVTCDTGVPCVLTLDPDQSASCLPAPAGAGTKYVKADEFGFFLGNA